MRNDLQALARHAVTLPGWRWMPGMLLWETARGSRDRVAGIDATHLHCWSEDFDCARGSWIRWLLVDAHRERTIVPDLSDPCTLGGVLQLVREAWMCPQVSVRYEMGRVWRCRHQDGSLLGEGPTEAAALIAALEAPPRLKP